MTRVEDKATTYPKGTKPVKCGCPRVVRPNGEIAMWHNPWCKGDKPPRGGKAA